MTGLPLPVAARVRSADLDLRLAIGAAAAWLAVLVALGHAPRWVLLAALVAFGIGVVALAAAHRGVRAASAGALVAFCTALVLIPLAGRLAHYRASPIVRLAAARTTVTALLTVRADPRSLAARGPAGSPRAAVETAADSVVLAGRRVHTDGDVLVLGAAQQWRYVLPGQRVRLEGTLLPPLEPSSMSVTLFARGPPELLGSPPWWQRGAGVVRASLRRAASGLPEDTRGLLPGLVDGDTADLDPVLAEHFRLAGLTHLVAVSGTKAIPTHESNSGHNTAIATPAS